MRAIMNGAYVAPRGEDAEVQGFLEGITLSSFKNAEVIINRFHICSVGR